MTLEGASIDCSLSGSEFLTSVEARARKTGITAARKNGKARLNTLRIVRVDWEVFMCLQLLGRIEDLRLASTLKCLPTNGILPKFRNDIDSDHLESGIEGMGPCRRKPAKFQGCPCPYLSRSWA